MSHTDKIISELQSQVNKLERDAKIIKYNYEEEKQINRNLNDRIEQLRREKAQMIAQKYDYQRRISDLDKEVKTLRKERSKFLPLKLKKSWHNLGSARAKYKRKMQYKDVLDNSMKCITECKRAKVILSIGNQDIDLKWSEEEMDRHRQNLGVNLPIENVGNDEDENSNEQSNDNIEHIQNEYQILDGDSKFTQRHKRTVITVMDRHRISHKAYHEIRKAGKSYWPSINVIKKEKKKMSTEIPFTTDETVRLKCNWHIDS